MATLHSLRQWIIPFVLLITSFGVYFTFYGSPQNMFWDENYHIASAQKHIDGVMYMEPHPPLGKMLMGLTEVLIGDNKNIDKHAFDSTDYIKGDQVPAGMRYTGFRWPSVVLMAFSALFFYGILARITQHQWFAFAFTALIIFDNALVVHARAAMLEGIQLFFILAALYYFVCVVTNAGAVPLKAYAILGVLIGLVISVKVNGFILFLLFAFLFFIDQWRAFLAFNWLSIFERFALAVPISLATVALVFLSVFYVHIGMGTKIEESKTYKASPEYLTAIRAGHTWRPSTFFVGMRDNIKYMSEYADGVPRLDECKSDENGSFAMDWVLGKKTISYRWDREVVNGKAVVHYMYLVGNPVVWFSVVFGILLSVGLMTSKFVYGHAEKDSNLFYWIACFTSLYLCYMIAILQIERVMYLYHYLVPLVFGMINFALVVYYIFKEELISCTRHTWINLLIYIGLVIAVFALFSPFTYGIGLTEEQFEMRNWFHFWKLQVAH